MILGFHCHFPLAYDDKIFEHLYSHKLKPFLYVLNKFPKIPVTIHFSGSLLCKIERNHSEFFVLLAEMVERKQVELLGGGFYEPMLSLALQADRIGQVELLTTYLRKSFGKRVSGCFLPPESWDIDLVSALSAAGMHYSFLPESVFRGTQIKHISQLYEPYITEDKGKTIIIFPVLDGFDNTILSGDPRSLFNRILHGTPESGLVSGGGIASLFPSFETDFGSCKDAEKAFTGFFQTASDMMEDRIEFTHASKCIKNQTSLSRIYIHANKIKQYFTECPESGALYSKTIWTKRLIDQIRGDKVRKNSAMEQLWKSQGYRLFCRTNLDEPDLIMNPLIRTNAYKNILAAENIALGVKNWMPGLLEDDFNFDGEMEYVFQGNVINTFIQKTGASVIELDYLTKTWNYLATFAANNEADGERVERLAFMDRLCGSEDGFFSDCRDCSKERYEVAEFDRKRGHLAFSLPSAACGPYSAVEIKKEYRLEDNIIPVNWTFTNKGTACEKFYFIPEINLTFQQVDDKSLRVYSYERFNDKPAGRSEKTAAAKGNKPIPNIQALELHDLINETLIRLHSEEPFNARFFPVTTKLRETISKKELVFVQSMCILPSIYIELESKASRTVCLYLGIY
jgi:hypothetical protein